MHKIILLLFVAAIIGMGAWASRMGYVVAVQKQWQPSDYVLRDGECWVHPQGDPLYDEHYAKNVNTFNCQSYKTQEQAKNINAQTRATDWEINQAKLRVNIILGVVSAMLLVLVFLIIRG